MQSVRVSRGLDLPIRGAPVQTIDDGPPIERVAVLGRDFPDLKPTMAVEQGERVTVGQTLFTDKHDPEVQYVAPGSGRVVAIHRGARRVLQSIVIELDDDSRSYALDDAVSDSLPDAGALRGLLRRSGLWTAFRTRPYSKIPRADAEPHAIFVTAIDTNPLAADPAVIIAERSDAFRRGLAAITRLTPGQVHVCTGGPLPGVEDSGDWYGLDDAERARVAWARFEGPHPAGLPGTHIHFLSPVSASRSVWHVGYQDVMAIGHLLETGEMDLSRVIALGGPVVKQPRLLRTRLGASTETLVHGELEPVEVRVISGSVLSGRRAANWAAYLGRHHVQVSVLREGRDREFLGWINPASKRFSMLNVFMSSFRRESSEFRIDTSVNGSPRAMVPIGVYERVMPLDVLPTQLLRALVVSDTDTAQDLGALELDEEDLALCSYICNGKYDFGPALRANLERIEKEG